MLVMNVSHLTRTIALGVYLVARGSARSQRDRSGCTMSFRHVNSSFEEWLRERCAVSGCVVVEADLKKKHRNMKKDPFIFLRATFFRWAGRIETTKAVLSGASMILTRPR
jgi:hypothetical protein